MKLNTPKDIKNDINQIIDEETKYVIQYFKEHNIPFHLENGIPIREDLPDEIEMSCLKCKTTLVMPYDLYMDMLEEVDPFELEEYLTLECPKCKADMIPTEFVNKK